MGVHIIIMTIDGEMHPKWDWTRHADDRENAQRLAVDNESWHSGKSIWEDDRFLLRPTATTELIGVRGAEMMEIFKDPKWWAYLSY